MENTASMTRESWLKGEIEMIKAGGTIRQCCTMATPDRVALGFCLGDIPADRAHRCLDTCSAECAGDKKRLRRWESAKGKCRACGHGLPRVRKPKIAKEIDAFPESGNEVENAR
jgi:hypothetical protein